MSHLPPSNVPSLILMASAGSATKTISLSRISVSQSSLNAKNTITKPSNAPHAAHSIASPITPAYSSTAKTSPKMPNVSAASTSTTSMQTIYANTSTSPTASSSTNNLNASAVLRITHSTLTNASSLPNS